MIEVRQFVNASEFRRAKHGAANYAAKADLEAITLIIFVPIDDEDILSKLSGEEIIEDVLVTVIAIGWM